MQKGKRYRDDNGEVWVFDSRQGDSLWFNHETDKQRGYVAHDSVFAEWILDNAWVELPDDNALVERQYQYDKAVVALDTLTTDDTHEGFSNRETWAATLHIRNDVELRQWAMTALEDAGHTPGQALLTLFDRLQGVLWDAPHTLSRYVRVALSDIGSQRRVNWDEVAAALRGEATP